MTLLPRAVLIVSVSALASCKAYQMPSVSMEPTILAGDYFIVSLSSTPPARKEVVVYSLNGQVYTKRVVGLPGDTLAMRAGILIVNGDSLAEPYAVHSGEQSLRDADFVWQRRFLLSHVGADRYTPTVTEWWTDCRSAGQVLCAGRQSRAKRR